MHTIIPLAVIAASILIKGIPARGTTLKVLKYRSVAAFRQGVDGLSCLGRVVHSSRYPFDY